MKDDPIVHPEYRNAIPAARPSCAFQSIHAGRKRYLDGRHFGLDLNDRAVLALPRTDHRAPNLLPLPNGQGRRLVRRDGARSPARVEGGSAGLLKHL
jgi:hypothetical protein